MKKNIALIGFMGAGKTAVGRKLAQKLNLKFMDLDTLIEERAKKPITEIFAQNGEAYFRQMEKEIVKEASQSESRVIACGGGAVLDPENIASLREKSDLVYLKTSAEIIFKRTRGKTQRPLLNVAEPAKRVEELLRLREPLYVQADYIVDTSALSVDEVVAEIIRRVIK